MSSAALLSSLAHPTRLDIVKALDANGELNVNEVSEKLGQSQATVSRHLIILRDAGAVCVRAQNTSRIYSVGAGVSGLVRLVDELTEPTA